METETTARRKAEALRRVIDRIYLFFKPTGVARPATELVGSYVVSVTEASQRPPSDLPRPERQLERAGENPERGRGSQSP